MSWGRRQVSSSRAAPTWMTAAATILLLAAVADWLSLRAEPGLHPHWILAALVSLGVLLLLLLLLLVIRTLIASRKGRGRRLGQSALLIGLVTLLLGGLGNWLLGLQGYVILLEGEAVPLHGGSHLQYFDSGPLARIEEMGMVLSLQEVELLPGAHGTLRPKSRLVVQRNGAEPVEMVLAPGLAGAAGNLRFYQGAFGFAPRIVILHQEKAVFDRIVPFTSERRGDSGVEFSGALTLASEQLEVSGAVDLSSLDAGLRGHATLTLEVRRDGVLLGGGGLLPGHFADVTGGYRIGFAGLEKWSEIDIFRRSYRSVVKGGAALFLVGVVLWGLARWRSW